ncbi:dihydrodipicolinate synthase family protein [Dictyobacter aurantiacus]|uniref:Dihydrodipicolinate synthase family protein n=1 Tax=Dictyobacter aurantiacus TaxID=1936993 RepID=A0A401ZAV2_9CHLR|nr:dihydrodipicolinate synthase family protein [Dictyobacter aurantiacus]GCE03985.1 dihydrodipicolinate synthase family protein [Dictyobacter aurantiacus]
MPGQSTILAGGIYPPVPTFFDPDQHLDLVTQQRHLRRLAASGIAGYVVMGSNGEAVHLDSEERARLLAASYETAVRGAEKPLPIIAGCGAQSTRQTIAYCEQAARYGASFALVLPPSYYPRRMDDAALSAHYRTVADASPLPVLIYNMPSSAAGINLSVDLILELARHPNITGIKDSSSDIVKLSQLVARAEPNFQIFAGSADILLPALVGGAIGAVAALANVFPRTVCRLQSMFEQEKIEEARILQARLIPANSAVTSKYGVAGLKAALEHCAGYGGLPRQPLQPLTHQEQRALLSALSPLIAGEKELEEDQELL